MSQHPNSPIFQRLTADGKPDMDAETDSRREHAIVKFTMVKTALAKFQPQLRKIIATEGGGRFSFNRFNEEFASFPMALGYDSLRCIGKPLHECQKASIPNWFRNFGHVPFVSKYLEKYAVARAAIGDRPYGLVFPRRGFKYGLVVHNGPMDTFVDPGHTCFVYFAHEKARASKRQTLLVQPFADLLASIHKEGRGWRYQD